MGGRIIVGIPGPWKDRSALVKALAGTSEGYLLVGQILYSASSKIAYGADVADHDVGLVRAFEIASGGSIPKEDIAEIGHHGLVLYCLSEGIGLEQARLLMGAVVAVLSAGGIAVKVESSGVAHSADRWRKLASSPQLFDTYTAFVTLVGNRECFYSCGMHCFGLPDAAVDRSLAPDEAAKTLNTFNHYQLSERPELKHGQSFSVDENSRKFYLEHVPCTAYAPDHEFHNPSGLWSLATGS